MFYLQIVKQVCANLSSKIELLEEHEAVDYAYESARQMVKKAQDEISFIPDTVFKTALLELGDYVIERQR